MRDVAHIRDAWRSGIYVGDNRPCSRVTVEKGWSLQITDNVLGTWNRGPARWYVDENGSPALRPPPEPVPWGPVADFGPVVLPELVGTSSANNTPGWSALTAWPDTTTHMIWAPDTTPIIAPGGTCRFRKDFTLATTARVRLWQVIDNGGYIEIDGKHYNAKPWQTNNDAISYVDIDLEAGSHHVFAECFNEHKVYWTSFGAFNPAMIAVAGVNTADGSIVFQTDSTWECQPYPPDPPTTDEIELTNVVSVNTNRGLDADAGTCDLVVTNISAATLDQPENPVGQFGDLGAYTWDHGVAQDARARWGHTVNAWQNVLVPNALIRTYQGFGGQDKPLAQAVADGNVVLSGVWLVDKVTIGVDGTISINCRDMAKLLLAQQLFPPLVPPDIYPLAYKRWDRRPFTIPPDDPPAPGVCYSGSYGLWDSNISQTSDVSGEWHSSTDEYFGQFNTTGTGHQPSEAFDITYEPADATQAVTPGYFAHQRTYWLSEPKGGPDDSVWIEFSIEGGASRLINEIYFHQFYYSHWIMVSIYENGQWVAPQTSEGGTTPQGVPFVCAFALRYDPVPGRDTNLYPLNRDYHASRVRLTITNLQKAPEGGFRAGARKIMACFSDTSAAYPTLVFAAAGLPVRTTPPERLGYWQVRSNGHIYAFGDARTYPANSPASAPASIVVGMAAHPSGDGYWIVDVTGRVCSHGQAQHHGDLSAVGRTDVIDLAPTPSGNGYWLLCKTGQVFSYGDAVSYGDSIHSGMLPTGVAATARSIESHPTTQGYWVLWADGYVDAHNLTKYGADADRNGFTAGEFVTAIRRTSTGAGYWILGGGGHVQARGDAPDKGGAGDSYAANDWYKGLCWDLIPSPKNDKGYAVQHADGKLVACGDLNSFSFGNIGLGSGWLRFDGNYKDYTDIVRELLLWAGFYLHKDVQPTAEMPDVFGNLESTGAYNDNDLPPDMFDKRPVLDAIKQIRDIVGYVFFIDAEGGARFESPNWWALGNYLTDGSPLQQMPEIDECVQLTGYSVVRDDASARSEVIIANSNPLPAKAGEAAPKGVITTRIVPRSKEDLRGLVVPAMWTNQHFSEPAEQKVMAEMIDLRTWMARRVGNVQCTANPLIDINDQVRVIERQTGEVYVHYIRSISTNHDLNTGEYTMSLSTHWLGGTPYGVNQRFLAGDTRPQEDGYWTATLGGYTSDWGTAEPGVYAHGNAALYSRHEDDSHLDLIVALRSTPSGLGYYTLDRYGKLLTYGDAVNRGDALRSTKDITDMALTPSGAGYWILQKDGVVLTFGDAVHYGDADHTGSLPDGSPTYATGIESHPTTQGYWILFNDGTVQAFNLTHHGDADRVDLNATEYFTELRRTNGGGGYWVLSAGGVVKAFGDATWHGNGTRYADENWVNGLTWILLANADGGYAIIHNDGMTDTFSGFIVRGPISPANDLLLWAIVTEEARNLAANPDAAFAISVDLMNFLENTGSPAALNAVAGGFQAPQEATFKAL